MNNNSAKVDRRKQVRQSAWNKPVLSNTNIDSTKKYPRPVQNHGGPMGHGSEHFERPNRAFSYDHTAGAAARKEMENRDPIVEHIRNTGNYELSEDREGTPAIIKFFPEFLTKENADNLYDKLSVGLPWQQRTGLNREGREYKEPRLTCWFGEPYVYSHVAWESNHEWPEILTSLRDKLAEKNGVAYNSVMCNLYRNDKDSIGWHADDEPSLGKNPNIASISLGCPRTFELKRKDDHYGTSNGAIKQSTHGKQYSVLLPHGSLLVMSGSVQETWLHRVPKEYHDKPARINLTFRVIVKSPNDHHDVRESTRTVISRGQDDKAPAVINYEQHHLDIHCLQECSNYLSVKDWVRPYKGDSNNPSPFQLCSFTSYDPWPEWLKNAGQKVSQICSARGDRRIEWSSAQCIFLQRGNEYVPWRFERGQNPVALVCLWGDRPIKLRLSRSAKVIGDLKTVTVTRCCQGDVFVMEGNLQRHWTFSIPSDPRAQHSSGFLLLRAEEPYPVGTLFQNFNDTANVENPPQLPQIILETAPDACGHADLCERCCQALSLGKSPDCPVCQAELRRPSDFTHP